MKIDFAKVQQHQLGLSKEGVPGNNLSKEDLKSMAMDDVEAFSADVAELRSPTRKDSRGKFKAPTLAGFSDLVAKRYGIVCTKEELQKDRLAAVRRYLNMFGMGTDFSIGDVAEFFGVDMSEKALESYLTTDIAKGSTFIIREIIMEPIRLGFMNASMAGNWIMRSQSMADQEVTVPQILKGEGTPRLLAEGETIPFGTVQFGSKRAKVNPVGTGFEMTEELMYRSTIDMLGEYVQVVGEDMGLAKDCLALDVLKNGEQADLSENAPMIGTEDGSTWAWKDVLRVVGHMRSMGNTPDVVITQEDDGLKIATIAEFQGFNGDTRLAEFSSIFGSLPKLQNFQHGLQTVNNAMFLASNRCMVELQWKPMKVARRENPQTRKMEFYTSSYVGYMIVRRDARVMLKNSVTFAGNGWPSYMNVGLYQNNPFTK